MKSLLLLDGYALWKQLKLFLGFIVLYPILALVSQNLIFMTFSTLFLCMLPYYLLQINNSRTVGALMQLMPLSRSTVVAERYLSALLSVACALPILLILRLVSGPDAAILMVLQIAACLSILALMLPLAYKLDPTKSRLLLMALMFLFFGATGAISNLTGDLPLSEIALDRWVPVLTAAALPVALALLGVSYLVSLRIYQKQEF